MNKYLDLQCKHQKEVNEFPMMFAFSKKQFKEGMEKLGLTEKDTDKIYYIGSGGFIRKEDGQKLDELEQRISKEDAEAMKDDEYVYEAFRYELWNHEYCITFDYDETLDDLGLTIEQVKKDERLYKILKKATHDYLKFDCK